MRKGTREVLVVNAQCTLRQSLAMTQLPWSTVDKVSFLTLLREAHIWARVPPGGQVGGSGGGDGEVEGVTRDAVCKKVMRSNRLNSTMFYIICASCIRLYNIVMYMYPV